MAKLLTTKIILKDYPDPVASYERNPGDYCILGIVCDYAAENNGFEWEWESAQGVNRFPSPGKGRAALMTLNPALESSEALDLSSIMIELNDNKYFDEAKQCLDEVLAFKGDKAAAKVLSEKWTALTTGTHICKKEDKEG